MQSILPSVFAAIRNSAVRGQSESIMSAPIELSHDSLKNVAGGLGPNGTWAAATAVVAGPNGTW
jgi:hypothetical protein